MPLYIQGNTYILNFYILTLGGCDVALGVQWLQTLGLFLRDFDKLKMDFLVMGQTRSLQGISPTSISLVEGEEFGKLTWKNHKDLILQIIEPVQLMSLTSS